MRHLVVLLDGRVVATVEQGKSGELLMRYEESWREDPESFPLSLSMPLATREHPDPEVRPFLEGLLPDNADILERWARRFHVSARNPFALLAHVGEDCAGAVQLVGPERVEDLLGAPRGEIDWLTRDEVAERLRDVARRGGTGRVASDRGQFSLAGAQPKTALFREGERWGVPSGAWPTTHILKPPTVGGLEGFDVNEHFCLTLARDLGLVAARTEVIDFGDVTALVVERYDRARRDDGTVVRLHQEDMCQAFAVPPHRKYENETGLGVSDIVNILLDESSDPAIDVGRFLDAIALSWAIAGTDAHAKNYSVLISARSVRLAPLYDLLSALPYPEWVHPREARLAMRIGGESSIRKIARRHWEALAARCELDAAPLLQRVGELIVAVPGAAERTAEILHGQRIDHEIVDRLAEAIAEHSRECLAALG